MPQRRWLVRGMAGMAVWLLLPTVSTGHSGGRVQLHDESFELEPATDGYHAKVVLIDQDSGATQTGFSVTVAGSAAGHGRFGPVTLTPLPDGRYEALITALQAGPLERESPGPGGPRY